MGEGARPRARVEEPREARRRARGRRRRHDAEPPPEARLPRGDEALLHVAAEADLRRQERHDEGLKRDEPAAPQRLPERLEVAVAPRERRRRPAAAPAPGDAELAVAHVLDDGLADARGPARFLVRLRGRWRLRGGLGCLELRQQGRGGLAQRALQRALVLAERRRREVGRLEGLARHGLGLHPLFRELPLPLQHDRFP